MSEEKNKKTKAEKAQKPPKVAKQKAEKVQKPPKVAKQKAEKVQKPPKVAKQKAEKVQKPPKVAKQKARTPITKKKKAVIAVVTVLITAALAAGLGLGFGMPKTRKVTFVFGDGAESIVKTAKSGTLLSALIGQLPAPETGYEYVVTDGSGAEVTGKIPDKDISLTVTVRAKKYSLTVETGEGAAKVTEVAYGSPLTLPQTPAKRGHTFAGWKDGSGNAVTAATLMPAGDLTVKAAWTVNKYLIKADIDGTVTTVEWAYGSEIKLTKPVKTGYTFAGWTGMPSDGKMPDKELTLTAQWAVSQYDLTFDTNGGNVITLRQVDYNTALGELPTPIKTGYTFSKWVKAGTSEEVTAATLMPLNGLSIQAVWTVNRHTLTFNFNDNGVTESTVAQKDYGTALVAPIDPTRTGYTFAGWDTTLPNTMPDSDLTLTAQWTANPYTLTFDTNGGESIDSYTVDYETALGALPTPVKTGYTFSKWVKFGTSDEATADTLMPVDGLTIQAVWTAIPYDLIFDTNGGESIDSYTVGYETALGALPTPIKTGHTFVKWVQTGTETEVTADTLMPLDGLNIQAVWVVNQYALTFNTDGGTEIAPCDVDYGASLGDKLPTPVKKPNLQKDEYTFYRWVATIEGTETEVTADTRMPAGGLTVKAQWYALSNLTFTAIDSNTAYSVQMSAAGQTAQVPDVVIPSTYSGKPVTAIASSAFRDMTFIKSIKIPSSVTTIGSWTFYGCSGLTAVTLPERVKVLEGRMFYGCTSLTSVTLPSGVTTIGEYLFRECTSLQSVTIPSGVTTIGIGVFISCTSLQSATIQEGVTTISESMFSNCTSLQSVTIPSSVTTISKNAFISCTSLTSITISKNVTTIEEGVFNNCSGLTSITVDDNNANYKSEGNCLLNKDGETLILGCKTSVIPEGVTTIWAGAFSGSGLTSITIPNGVTIIGDSAFNGCRPTTITIPKGVTIIGAYAFNVGSGGVQSKIYYTGTSADKSGLSINSTGNAVILVEEKWYYYSATQPTDTSVKYWHYDTDGKTILEW